MTPSPARQVRRALQHSAPRGRTSSLGSPLGRRVGQSIGSKEVTLAKLLFVGTEGTNDPTKATFPFLMAKGAIEAGHETAIILMGDAALLIKDQVAAEVHGVGLPPLSELQRFLHERGVAISV